VKNSQPKATSAILVVAPGLSAQVAPFTHCMRKLGFMPSQRLFRKETEHSTPYAVYYDKPVPYPTVPLAALTTQALHTSSSNESGLAFVFDAQLAGAPAQGIWDSGAATQYVEQYGMAMQACDSPVVLAVGSSKSACGTITIKVRIQKYTHTATFMVSFCY
jgi:hypothetical protein